MRVISNAGSHSTLTLALSHSWERGLWRHSLSERELMGEQ